MKVLPSLLAADFLNLSEELDKLKASEYDLIHYDVMDGTFVPNISFGDEILKTIIKNTDFKFDVHLMTDNVFENIKRFVQYQPEYITFHIEAVQHKEVQKIINYIKNKNIKVGIALKPGTQVDEIKEFLSELDLVLTMSVEPGFGGQSFMPTVLDKIKRLAVLRVETESHYVIQVDGGIDENTGRNCIESGADYIVIGTSLFKSNNYQQIKNKMME